jgi:hypothetical protein
MRFTLRLCAVALLAIILVAGCGKKDEEGTPSEPASTTQTTNAQGQANLTLGSFSVETTVQNGSGTPLPNIGVSGYLLHNNILLIAGDPGGAYLPAITVTGLSSLARPEAPGHIQSPDQIAEAAFQVTLTMQPIQSGVYGITPDPANFDAIVSDAWTSESAHSGGLSTIYNILDTTGAFSHGAIVHLSQNVATPTSAPFRTALFGLDDQTSYAAFASLFGLVFHIFEGDTLGYDQVSYQSTTLPIINVDNITLHRDFWGQFTLIWGQDPHDLDSHLWTPIVGNTYLDTLAAHVCYYRMGDSTTAPYAILDVDDVSSYGPEHVTIYENIPGTYVFAVHHYSGEGTIASSGAAVSFLKPDGTVQTFAAPPAVPDLGDDWYWHICSVDGQTGAVTPINTYSPNPPRPDMLAIGETIPAYKNAD